MSANDFEDLRYAGRDTGTSLTVEVNRGLFIQEKGSTSWSMSTPDAFVVDVIPGVDAMPGTIECIGNWEDVFGNGTRYRNRVTVSGTYKDERTETLTLKAALERNRKIGAPIEVPGFGKCSTEAEINAAFSGQKSKTFTIISDGTFKVAYNLIVEIKGPGEIRLTVEK